jgi:histidinol-phosphate phosphatase family protein
VQAVVLAGGRGSRLDPSGEAPPKPLTALCGVPALDHILGWLAREGIGEAVICTSYRAEMIEAAVGDGSRFGMRVSFSHESVPLGTAGAVKLAAPFLEDRFLVVYGDVLANVHVAALWRAHAASRALATLVVHPNEHPFDSDRVVADARGFVRRVIRKEERVGPEAGNLCSAALYVCEKRLLEHVPGGGKASDFARDVFPELARSGARLLAYRTSEYLKDMGTAARRTRVEDDLRSGVPGLMRRSAQRPAVLLDRDGVLVEEVPYLSRSEDLLLIPGAAEALRRLNRANVLAACVTNQPVVARGEIDEEMLCTIHRRLEGLVGKEGAWLDGVFVCPHHPHRGFPGERTDLKIDCDCRKPLPGLVTRAESEMGIDRRSSILVGDRTTDLECARAAGVVGVGVLTGAACRDGKYRLLPETPLVPSLSEAVSLLLDGAPSWDPWLERVLAAGVVLLGGPSRAGKTLAANALRLRLQARGVPVVHVSLDRFIQPAPTRSPGSTVRDRTRFDEARHAVRRLVAGDAVLLPGYDPSTRGGGPAFLVQRPRGSVLIVDGVLAAAIDVPGALRIALEAPADLLRARRQSFYAWKDVEKADLDALVLGREEEHRAVAEAAATADLHLAFDDSQRMVETS